MIFQNFGFNRVLLAEGGAVVPTFPDQSLTTWTTTETAAWLSAGATLTTASFGYATSSVRIGSAYTSTAQWYGAALASNGKIYCPPHTTNNWAIINTATDTVATTGSIFANNCMGARYDKITNQVFALGDGGTKITCTNDSGSNISGPPNRQGGAVQSFDGNKLYTIGLFGTTGVYEYDISANSSSFKASTGGDRYTHGTLAANGKIFWGGGGGTQFTAYEPSTNTLTNFGTFSGDYTGPMVAHYDGYIYNFPRFFNQSVIRINPTDNSYTTIHTLSVPTNIISMGACIGLDGRIYVVRENGGVYWYDPYSNTSDVITMEGGDSSFAGITMGMYGDLYVVPYNADYFHKISLTTGAGATANAIVQQYNFGGRMCWQ